MLETDALKEKLEMEIHRFARPPEELSSGDPYFEQLQTMLAIRDELENIPLCDIQRNMLLAMENVLESAWYIKAAMNLMGMEAGSLRLPLCDISHKNLETLRQAMGRMGLL